MNNSLSELYSKRTQYKMLRENVYNAINILSKNSISDNLSTAAHTLDTCYLVNEQSSKSASIKSIKEVLETELKNLNVCLDSLNNKIYNLDKIIEEKEAAGAVGM